MKLIHFELIDILNSAITRVIFAGVLAILVAGLLAPSDLWAEQKPNDQLRENCASGGGILDDDGGEAVVCTWPGDNDSDIVVGCDNTGCSVCGLYGGCFDFARGSRQLPVNAKQFSGKRPISINQISVRRFPPKIRARLRAVEMRKKSQILGAKPPRKFGIVKQRAVKKSGQTQQQKGAAITKPTRPGVPMPTKPIRPGEPMAK